MAKVTTESGLVLDVFKVFRLGSSKKSYLTDHGTILLATVVAGTVKLNDTLQIGSLTDKVVNLQIDRKNVKEVAAGQKVGICLAEKHAKVIAKALGIPHRRECCWQE